MITGAHSIIYSTDPDADRAFFRDILQFPQVESGSDWLIFELPPAELAVHPADRNNIHEIYLKCDNIKDLRKTLSGQNIPCSKVEEMPWGSLVRIRLPGGGELGIYQPRHRRPVSAD